MPKLSKDQKLAKRWARYYVCLDEHDHKLYSVDWPDNGGLLHFYINGFPAPQEFTRKYNGAKRRARRNKRR